MRRKVPLHVQAQQERRQKFADALADLQTPVTLGREDFDRIVSLVREHGLTYNDFVALDEKPGQFMRRDAWHWKLRQCRNQGPPEFFNTLHANAR